MKKNLMLSIVAALAMFLVMGINSVYAATCTNGAITRVVVLNEAPSGESSQYKIQLNCDEYANERNYYLSSTIGDSGYATVLTAISLTKTLYMEMTGTASGSLVTLLRMNN